MVHERRFPKLSSKDKWNARNYDCVSIRFPKGTKTRFKQLFPGVPFNSFVVNLLTSKMMDAEFFRSEVEDKKNLL